MDLVYAILEYSEWLGVLLAIGVLFTRKGRHTPFYAALCVAVPGCIEAIATLHWFMIGVNLFTIIVCAYSICTLPDDDDDDDGGRKDPLPESDKERPHETVWNPI
jgi:hypothetical protein